LSRRCGAHCPLPPPPIHERLPRSRPSLRPHTAPCPPPRTGFPLALHASVFSGFGISLCNVDECWKSGRLFLSWSRGFFIAGEGNVWIGKCGLCLLVCLCVVGHRLKVPGGRHGLSKSFRRWAFSRGCMSLSLSLALCVYVCGFGWVCMHARM